MKSVDFTTRSILRGTLLWTLIFEGLTCALRFGAALESTRDTASTVGQLTAGLRIHHSYIGLLLVPLATLYESRSPRFSKYLIVLGLSLLCSDLIHHFVVLWLVTGSPQFDLMYAR